MRSDFALYLVGVVEFDIQREAGYSPCVKAVAQPSRGIYVLVGDISGELVRNDYRRVLVEHGGSDEDRYGEKSKHARRDTSAHTPFFRQKMV